MVKVIPKNTRSFEFLSVQVLRDFVRFRNDIPNFLRILSGKCGTTFQRSIYVQKTGTTSKAGFFFDWSVLLAAYTGEFRRRFFPTEPHICPCEEGVTETREHVISSCSRYERWREGLRKVSRDISLAEILGTEKGTEALAHFLQKSGAFTTSKKDNYPYQTATRQSDRISMKQTLTGDEITPKYDIIVHTMQSGQTTAVDLNICR
ncbi:hypothetical protein BDQ17DRAFT_1377640 [Cyathus striatus]|nr:hypothetical protein BDQ17DRAFT_1377640 [Cyathus striatus]